MDLAADDSSKLLVIVHHFAFGCKGSGVAKMLDRRRSSWSIKGRMTL